MVAFEGAYPEYMEIHRISNAVYTNYAEFHNIDPSSLPFCGIEKYKPHWRGDKKCITLSKTECC